MSTTPLLLKLTGIARSFGGVQALRGVSFDLHAGEVHALVGENGAGKSTLIKIICGAEQPDDGEIDFAGNRLENLDPHRARRLGIAVIHQQPALFPDLSVAENIALGTEFPRFWQPVRWKFRRAAAARILHEIGARIDPDEEVGRLSMPEQQLVEIARALSGEARLLILDEPTASLSESETAHLFSIVRRLKSQGVGLIYISHRLDELPQIADRVTVLRDGEIVETRRMAEAGRADLVRLMVGRELATVFPRTFAPPGDVLLEARRISSRAAGIHDVSLSIHAGEIVGLAGLMGAGRTELASVLFGLSPADAGEILVRGRKVTIGSPVEAGQLGLALVPEDRRRHGVVLDMTVAANTSLALLARQLRFRFCDFSAERQLAGGFVERFGVRTPSVEARVGNLSGGNQQKVALARWLATNPVVLILDEPTQGIDIGAKAEIHRLMNELADRGLSVLMISSDLPEVLGMSDRILVMHAGTIAGELDRAAATQERIMELALGAGAAAEATA
jgi:rhamnose transport system ATP-binding protein